MKVLLMMEQDRDHMISEAYELIRKAMKNEKIDLNVVVEALDKDFLEIEWYDEYWDEIDEK